jgi:hypothetical protein
MCGRQSGTVARVLHILQFYLSVFVPKSHPRSLNIPSPTLHNFDTDSIIKHFNFTPTSAGYLPGLSFDVEGDCIDVSSKHTGLSPNYTVLKLRTYNSTDHTSIPGNSNRLLHFPLLLDRLGGYPASYMMGTGGSFPRTKAAEMWSWPFISI